MATLWFAGRDTSQTKARSCLAGTLGFGVQAVGARRDRSGPSRPSVSRCSTTRSHAPQVPVLAKNRPHGRPRLSCRSLFTLPTCERTNSEVPLGRRAAASVVRVHAAVPGCRSGRRCPDRRGRCAQAVRRRGQLVDLRLLALCPSDDASRQAALTERNREAGPASDQLQSRGLLKRAAVIAPPDRPPVGQVNSVRTELGPLPPHAGQARRSPAAKGIRPEPTEPRWNSVRTEFRDMLERLQALVRSSRRTRRPHPSASLRP